MRLADLGIPLDLAPMEARLTEELPGEGQWQFEPKWDGFRCLAFRAGNELELKAKSGKSLTRFFPEVRTNLLALRQKTFVLDGELMIRLRSGAVAFDALQMRLHPAASRIARLAAETPAILMTFDCLLRKPRRSLVGETLEARRSELEDFFSRIAPRHGLELTPITRDRRQARQWLSGRNASLDGVVAKPLGAPYLPGERAMLKIKRLRTADCVVGGFRYESERRVVGSLLLGLYDEEGLLHHVGFTSAIRSEDKPDLTKRLEKLIAPPGFTGNAPGAPSRWSTERSAAWEPLRPSLVAEVRYDHVSGNRFRHGTRFVRWRPDKAPRQCTFDQLEPGS